MDSCKHEPKFDMFREVGTGICKRCKLHIQAADLKKYRRKVNIAFAINGLLVAVILFVCRNTWILESKVYYLTACFVETMIFIYFYEKRLNKNTEFVIKNLEIKEFR